MNKKLIYASFVAGLLMAIMFGTLVLSSWPNWQLQNIPDDFTVMLGNLLFSDYGLTFLIVGFVLFTSMLAGVFIAQEEKE